MAFTVLVAMNIGDVPPLKMMFTMLMEEFFTIKQRIPVPEQSITDLPAEPFNSTTTPGERVGTFASMMLLQLHVPANVPAGIITTPFKAWLISCCTVTVGRVIVTEKNDDLVAARMFPPRPSNVAVKLPISAEHPPNTGDRVNSMVFPAKCCVMNEIESVLSRGRPTIVAVPDAPIGGCRNCTASSSLQTKPMPVREITRNELEGIKI